MEDSNNEPSIFENLSENKEVLSDVQKQNKMSRTKSLILISLFVSLLCISGLFLKVPMPPVPFSMTSFFAITAGAILGKKKGVIACFAYMFMGTVCYLPVFTKGGGLWYVLEPTFGYILGYIIAAFIAGFIDKKTKTVKIGLIFTLAAFSVLVIGSIYAGIVLSITSPIPVWDIFFSYFVLFLPSDILKAVLATVVYKSLKNTGLF
ncbi:MAG: biotin transporter BioY [Firmicutes bacterium]|nr:biotin transporter BioY [Bacillota bacterium]